MRKKLFLLCITACFFFAVSAFACEHYDSGQVAFEDLRTDNAVSPEIGREGYTGDLRCPVCNEIVEYGSVIPARPEEAEKPASSNQEAPPDPTPVEKPAPEPAKEPDPPAAPAQAEEPAKPETQAQPEAPAKQEAQPQPEAPGKQETQPQPEPPAGPETPASREEPAQPEASVQTAPSAPADKGAEKAPSAKPPKAKDVKANKKPDKTDTATTQKQTRQPVSGTRPAPAAPEEPSDPKGASFPFRRVRMNPKPGIRAEAAGTLLWPAGGTPFQVLFND